MAEEDFKRSYPLRTVCEVTREIHWEMKALKLMMHIDIDHAEAHIKKIIRLLAEQMRMQKKMDKRLRRYKADYEKKMFKPNEDFGQDNERYKSL